MCSFFARNSLSVVKKRDFYCPMLYFAFYYITFWQVSEDVYSVPVPFLSWWRHELASNSTLVLSSFDSKCILQFLFM